MYLYLFLTSLGHIMIIIVKNVYTVRKVSCQILRAGAHMDLKTVLKALLRMTKSIYFTQHQ